MTFSQSNPWKSPFGNDTSLAVWTALGNGDASNPALGAGWTDRSVQLDGTFDGATVTLKGSNDGVTYFILNDPFGDPISVTSAALRQVTEVAAYVIPSVSGGGGAVSVNVTLLMVRHP